MAILARIEKLEADVTACLEGIRSLTETFATIRAERDHAVAEAARYRSLYRGAEERALRWYRKLRDAGLV